MSHPSGVRSSKAQHKKRRTHKKQTRQNREKRLCQKAGHGAPQRGDPQPHRPFRGEQPWLIYSSGLSHSRVSRTPLGDPWGKLGDPWAPLGDLWAFLGDPLISRGDPWEGFQGPRGCPLVSMGDSMGDPGASLGDPWAPRGDPGASKGGLWASTGGPWEGFLEKALKLLWKAKVSFVRP